MKLTDLILCIILFASPLSIYTQKKTMTPEVYDIWNELENVSISSNGDWIAYNLEPGKGDATLVLYNTLRDDEIRIPRGHGARFDYKSQFLACLVAPHEDSIRMLKKNEVDKDEWPRDTLVILDLQTREQERIPHVASFRLPEKSTGLIAWHYYPDAFPGDTTLVRKEGDEQGQWMGIRNIMTGQELLIPYVLTFKWSEKNNRLLFHDTGRDSTQQDAIRIYDAALHDTMTLICRKGHYHNMSINNSGNRVAFVADFDSLDNGRALPTLFYWTQNDSMARVLSDETAPFLEEGWRISPHRTPMFSDNSKRLYFGVAPLPPLGDTSLLEEEKADVEVWHYEDPYLYTQQKERAEWEKKRSYTVMYQMAADKFTTEESPDIPETYLPSDLEGPYTFSYNELPYLQFISWVGYAYKDLYLTDIRTGTHKKIAHKIQGSPALSPGENYIYWYSRPDTAWWAYDIVDDTLRQISSGQFYDELNDRPMHPSSEGAMGWTENDSYLIVYDAYDIWLIDPKATSVPERVTLGRELDIEYRYIELDDDTEYFPADTTVLLKYFDKRDKSSGYVYLSLANFKVSPLLGGPYNYSSRVYKADNSREIVYTRSNFETFPNLILSDTTFLGYRIISDANPQQSEYAWGTIELVSWEDSMGQVRKGMLVKPPDFDPSRKYPMIINFYERSSDRLHRHRAPYPHRSTINYSYYANRGYLIFNPDVIYRVGHPGDSALEAVTSGARAMIDRGYVDSARIGLQGHSWGGYQVAHIITKTDMFACAEAGAPVVNMVSAYGGIRWSTGRSRMFQYERTQSRLGTTLWDDPDRYLDNSPIFNVDKINTPVLILHNDKDGAVPWYQGIEFFAALRRLSKPAWLLNYPNEPHWPLTRPNRLDFNLRMQQFFDHYLMDKPMPEWMSKGIPAVEQGLNYGFEMEGR